MNKTIRIPLLAAATACLWLSACSTVYYNALEAVGIPKRELLVSRVESAQESQQAAKEQFQSALDQFAATVDFEGGDLEALYDRLNKEYERSESRADAVHARIKDVESVSKALFAEWEAEIQEISSASLRSQSQATLTQTKARYGELMQVMQRAESRIQPVLTTFKDHVLFLKHNLNARAIASLGKEISNIESDVQQLVDDMEAAIREASEFIAEMQGA